MHPRIEEFLAYAGSVRSLSPRTVAAYKEDLSLFASTCERCGADVETAAPAVVRGFVADLVREGYASTSINRSLSAVKGLFRFLVRFGYRSDNPARDVESLSTAKSLPSFLFEGEMRSFIDGGDAAPDDAKESTPFALARNKALFETLYSTGCRVSEIAGLRLADLQLDAARAKVKGKGSRERIVFLSPAAVAAIAAYLPYRSALAAKRAEAAAETLFLSARGGPLSTRGIAWLVERHAAAAGLSGRFSTHGFRHSFATHLVGHGADVRTVQAMLGHASISTTQIYTHVDLERLRKVYADAHPHAGKKRAHKVPATEAQP